MCHWLTPAYDSNDRHTSHYEIAMSLIIDVLTYTPAELHTFIHSYILARIYVSNEGELVLVVGKVGSGKSSLVNAMLRECICLQNNNSSPGACNSSGESSRDSDNKSKDAKDASGSATTKSATTKTDSRAITKASFDTRPRASPVVVKGSLAYAPQRAWIMADSVKNNILLGGVTMDQYRSEGDHVDRSKGGGGGVDSEVYYQRVLQTCNLLPDLTMFDYGDETQVGEKGKACMLYRGMLQMHTLYTV